MIKKEITFIYSDSVEKSVCEMISAEAVKRGYKTVITDDKFARCEIGWYCQHINFPKYSKFSIIMLHDIIQQYPNWPDIWLREPGNKYDIGFLPSLVWEKNWKTSSGYFYSRPRKGIFVTGWPKADRLKEYMGNEHVEDLKIKYGIDPLKPTVIYAPAWENDGKQDDFVQSMLPLDVNIIIKQAPWSDKFPDQLKNIAEMRELHSNNVRVIQLDPQINILDAIMVSDVLVSEESSTMCECVMMGKPAISVCDWLIPDVTPSRFPADDYDFTIKTTKEDLTECVENVLDKYDKYSDEAVLYSKEHFSNIGNCIPMMMDIVDSYVNGSECPYLSLIANNKEKVPLKKLLFFYKERIIRTLYYNYKEQYLVFGALWNFCRRIKNIFIK